MDLIKTVKFIISVISIINLVRMTDPPERQQPEVKENFYQLKTLYSVTLNPEDSHQYYGEPPLDRIRKFHNFCNVNMLQTGGIYRMVIEISEPRDFQPQGKYKGPRLHMHGTIRFDDNDQLLHFLSYGYYMLTRWTSTKFDTTDGTPAWYNYCNKQHVVPEEYRYITNDMATQIKEQNNVVKRTRAKRRKTRKASNLLKQLRL